MLRLSRPQASHTPPLAPESLVAPRVIAFDLDGTLWMPEMDTLRWRGATYGKGGAPFRPGKREGTVLDSAGTEVYLMEDSLEILRHVVTDPAFQGVQVAYVSRTDEVEMAKQCLQAMEVVPGRSMHDAAAHLQIFPDRKIAHFDNIRRMSGVPFEEMLFFDNERRNIHDCSPLGITCVHCPDGMTTEVWQRGLAQYAAAHWERAAGGGDVDRGHQRAQHLQRG